MPAKGPYGNDGEAGVERDLYSCGHCGFIEGERPQAGCCANCGQASESHVGEYVPASQHQGAVEARDLFERAMLEAISSLDAGAPAEKVATYLRTMRAIPAGGQSDA